MSQAPRRNTQNKPQDIRIGDFFTYLAYYLKSQSAGKDFAIAFDSKGHILGVGIDARVTDNDLATPIVNVLQALAAEGLPRQVGPKYYVYLCSTYEPTPACHGMATLRKFTCVFWAKDNWIQVTVIRGNPGKMQTVAAGRRPRSVDIDQALGEWYNNLPGPAKALAEDVNKLEVSGPVQLPGAGFAVPDEPAATNAPPEEWRRVWRRGLYMTLAAALVSARTLTLQQPEKSHNIGCVMVSPAGKILAYGVNDNALNPTFHAETQLVLRYQLANGFEALEAETTIYTTLEPCHMCAGMIVTAGQNIRVVFGQSDPYQRNNVLTRGINGCTQQGLTLTTRQLSQERLIELFKKTRGLSQWQRDEPPRTRLVDSEVGIRFMLNALFDYLDFPWANFCTAADQALWRQGLKILMVVNGDLPFQDLQDATPWLPDAQTQTWIQDARSWITNEIQKRVASMTDNNVERKAAETSKG